jgi:hypothetical protein
VNAEAMLLTNVRIWMAGSSGNTASAETVALHNCGLCDQLQGEIAEMDEVEVLLNRLPTTVQMITAACLIESQF